MALIEYPVPIDQRERARPRPGRQHQVGHDGRRLPLAWRDTRIQVGKGGQQQSLPHIGPGPAPSIYPCSMVLTHQWLFLSLAGARLKGPLDSFVSLTALESLSRV